MAYELKKPDKGLGVFPAQYIHWMMKNGIIQYANSQDNLGSASLDLTLSGERYRLEGVFQPHFGEEVRSLLKNIDAVPHPADAHFERGVVYLVRATEIFHFLPGMFAKCNPKSTTGRLDIHIRLIVDGEPSFDSIPPGFSGEVWFLIVCNSFPVKINVGETLAQIRILNKEVKVTESEIQTEISQEKLLWSPDGRMYDYDYLKISDRDGTLILTLDLSEDIVGWECRGSSRVFDFSKRNYYEPTDFFQPLRKNRSSLVFRDSFCILYTRERVRVPPHLACDMIPMSTNRGELRAHYAGFIDPGFGYGKEGEGVGRRLVLEVRAFESNLIFRKGQGIAKIAFERLIEPPPAELIYDARSQSNYNTSQHSLSKHFRKPE